jgi:hypothetical protein
VRNISGKHMTELEIAKEHVKQLNVLIDAMMVLINTDLRQITQINKLPLFRGSFNSSIRSAENIIEHITKTRLAIQNTYGEQEVILVKK